jgi:5-methylcytosine-specific restriction endonuclease McrA
MLGNGTKPYDRRAVFERDEGTCWLCHEPIDWALSGWDRWGFTIDHVVPISKGGIDTFENVKSAHRSCNSRRGNRVTIVKRREVTSAN